MTDNPTRSAAKDAPTFGKCQRCPRHVRLTYKGKMGRHKRLKGASEYGNGKVWCEGSGTAPASVLPPGIDQ